MNAENVDDFLHRLATNVKTQYLTKRHAAFTFESVHVKSQNDFCCFRRVIWFLRQCFKLLSFLRVYLHFFLICNFCIYNRYTIPFSISIACSLGLWPNTKFKL